MAKKVCRARSRGSSRASDNNTSSTATGTTTAPSTPATATPHPEAGVGVLVGTRIAKRFDVPTPSRRTKAKTKARTTKKRRGRPPKNAPPPRPETPPPTIITKEIYYGTVTGYNHLDADYVHHDDDVGLYRVHYDDGDTEVLDPDEVYAAFLLHNGEMLRMDIERSRAYPFLASKIAPTWREATTTATGGGGGGLAHQRDLTEEELIVLDAERIGYWESYKAYNLSAGVTRPLPFSPTADNRKHRPQEQDATTRTTSSTGGQTAGELSGSNEVVQPTSASGSANSMTTARRSERATTRAASAAAAFNDSTSAVAKSPTPRRNKRRDPEAAVASDVAGNIKARGQRSNKRRKKTSDATSSNSITATIDSNLSEVGGQEEEGDDPAETATRVKKEAAATGNGRGWGLFRWTQTVGFGDICDLT